MAAVAHNGTLLSQWNFYQTVFGIGHRPELYIFVHFKNFKKHFKKREK